MTLALTALCVIATVASFLWATQIQAPFAIIAFSLVYPIALAFVVLKWIDTSTGRQVAIATIVFTALVVVTVLTNIYVALAYWAAIIGYLLMVFAIIFTRAPVK